jgi:IstB-like ATP binding protein
MFARASASTGACACTLRPSSSSSTSSASDSTTRLVATALFSLVAARYERGSIVLTSNKGLRRVGEVLGDGVIATAIDRLLQHSHVPNIRGESYRLQEKKQLGLFGSPQSSSRLSRTMPLT